MFTLVWHRRLFDQCIYLQMNQGRAFRSLLEIYGQIFCHIWCEKGAYPGEETPDIPDEPDVLDGGDAVEGLGGGGLASSLSSVTGFSKSLFY